MEEKYFLVAVVDLPRRGNYTVRLNAKAGTIDQCKLLRDQLQQDHNNLSFVVGHSCTDKETEYSFSGELWKNSVIIYTIQPESSRMFSL